MKQQLKTLLIEDEEGSLKRLEKVLSPFSDIIAIHTIAKTYEDAFSLLSEKKEEYNLSIVDLNLHDERAESLFEKINISQFGVVAFTTIEEEIRLPFQVLGELKEIYHLHKPYSYKGARLFVLKLLGDKRLTNVIKPISVLEIKDGDAHIIVPVEEIWFIESADNYCKIYCKNRYGQSRSRPFILRSSLDFLSARLDSTVFQRCHNSYIVNTDRIERYRLDHEGGYLYFDKEKDITGFIDSNDKPIEIKFSPAFRDWLIENRYLSR